MFGRYEIGEQPVPGFFIKSFLGAGSFGSVYSATGPGGSEVAIKRINLQQYGDKELRALRLVKRIRHPNVVPLTGFWLRDQNGELIDDATVDRLYRSSPDLAATLVCTDDGTRPAELIVVMGLADMSLEDRLRECQGQGLSAIPVDELLRYMDDAARAIDFLNKKQHRSDHGLVAIQHCDIKPQNILIVGGAAQLCDLGLARILDDARQTRAAFSAAYGAPECLTGSSPSAGTDQYSLAVSYVELRTGQLPFEDPSSHLSVIQAHVESRLDLKRLTPAERTVIRRATSKNPVDRFETVQAMVDALRQASQSSTQTKLTNAKQSLRRMTLVVGGSSVVLTLVAATTIWRFPELQRPFARAVNSISNWSVWPAPEDSPLNKQPLTPPLETVDNATNNSSVPSTDEARKRGGRAEVATGEPIAESLSEETGDDATQEEIVVETDPVIVDQTDVVTTEKAEASEQPTEDALESATDAASDGVEVATDEESLEVNTEQVDSDSSSTEPIAPLPTMDLAALHRSLGRRAADNLATAQTVGFSSMQWMHAGRRGVEGWLVSQIEQQAQRQVERGHDKEAVALYTQLIQRDRDHFTARLQRGLAFVRLGQYTDAMNDYSQMIELDRSSSETADAYRLRGVARAKHGDFPGALTDLTLAIDRGVVATASCHRMRALVLLQQKQYAEAVQDAAQVAELDAKLLLVLPLRVQGNQVWAETESGEKIPLEDGKPLRLLQANDGRLLVSFQLDGREQRGWIDEGWVEPSPKF